MIQEEHEKQSRGLPRRADVELVLLPVAPREHGQRVRLGVEHPLVERDELFVRCDQERVFESVFRIYVSEWSEQ